MTLDEEIADLEKRRDACLASMDERVDKLTEELKSAFSISAWVKRFPAAAVGAALVAGVAVAGPRKHLFAAASHVVRRAMHKGRAPVQPHAGPVAPHENAGHASPPGPPQKPGGIGGLWEKALPMAEVAIPLLLERVPWGRLSAGIKAKLHGAKKPSAEPPKSPL